MTTARDILNPEWWEGRMAQARELDEEHRAVFVCTKEKWRAIEQKHYTILCEHVKPADSILDVGCGWGRLLNLMPCVWHGDYLGIDQVPTFIELARRRYARRCTFDQFILGDIRDIERVVSNRYLSSNTGPYQFDLAVLVSIRPMLIRHLGGDAWAAIESGIRKVAKKLLYLEYDETDPGSLE